MLSFGERTNFSSPSWTLALTLPLGAPKTVLRGSSFTSDLNFDMASALVRNTRMRSLVATTA